MPLRQLELKDRSDPAAMLVAKRIVEVASQGERDPETLRQLVLKIFQHRPRRFGSVDVIGWVTALPQRGIE